MELVVNERGEKSDYTTTHFAATSCVGTAQSADARLPVLLFQVIVLRLDPPDDRHVQHRKMKRTNIYNLTNGSQNL